MSMQSGGYRALTQSVSQQLATLRSDMPDVMKGFGELARAATRDGALDRKTKEFIALGMAIYMGGGPSAMYCANALAAFEEFSAPA